MAIYTVFLKPSNQGMEASAATIRDRIRRQNAVTLNHQQAIYTEKLRPSRVFCRTSPARRRISQTVEREGQSACGSLLFRCLSNFLPPQLG